MPDSKVRGDSTPGRRPPRGERSRPTTSTGGLTAHPGRLAVAVVSALVLVVTGFAWRSVDALEANLATARLGLGGAKDGALDILMVGTDSRTDAHGNPLSQGELDSLRAGDAEADNTDTVVLIRVPVDGSSATALSIPRDSYVDVPGIGKSKINAAFGATKATELDRLKAEGESDSEAERQATQAGREALIKSVANLTGVTVDHYAEVGLLGFVLLTDAVGGVDVCLNNPVDEWMSGARFPAGEQTLRGADALSFVRQRHDLPRGDLDRIVRQQVFMASLVHQVLSAKTLSNPSKLGQLSSAVQRSVVIDDDWDILGFAKQLQGLAGGEVKFETIPVVDINATTDYGESIVQVDPKAVRKYVASLAGQDDDPDTEATPSVDPSTVTVDVANDSGIGGLASRVAETLSAKGFLEGAVGNNTGTSVSTSRVLAADSDSDGAKSVAATLGGLQVVGDSTLPANTVRVVLATDYSGPGSASATASGSAEPTSDIVEKGTNTTPVPPGPAIDAGRKGPQCVN